MKICLITNPKSGNADKAEQLIENVKKLDNITIFEAKDTDDAFLFAGEAVKNGFDMVVAAGGDGTINKVVNGLAADFSKIILGIIPLGTGNDLARTLAIPFEPLEALELLMTGESRK